MTNSRFLCVYICIILSVFFIQNIFHLSTGTKLFKNCVRCVSSKALSIVDRELLFQNSDPTKVHIFIMSHHFAAARRNWMDVCVRVCVAPALFVMFTPFRL